jgi:hypothetical protein
MASSTADQGQLAQKLEAFVKSLSPEEVSMFTSILQPKGQLSESDLASATGGAVGAASFSSGRLSLQSIQPRQLNAALFRKLMDW